MIATNDCPAIVDLLTHPAHARGCPRCRVLRASVANINTGVPAATGRYNLALEQRDAPSEGEVWAVRGFDRMGLALVGSLPGLEMVAVSDQWRLALDTDMVLDGEALGFRAIIRTRLRGSLLAEQLDERVGMLSATQLAQLQRGPADDEPWGPSVLIASDPRVTFAEEEATAWNLLTEPAHLLAGTLTLGALVSAARTRREIGQDELADSMTIANRELALLETDDADLLARWPPATLGRLFRKLGLIWCGALADRVRAAVEISPISRALPAAFHRSASSQEDATAYMDAVAAAMTDHRQ